MVDEEDLHEASRTRFVLRASVLEILKACVSVVTLRPAHLFSVLYAAWMMGRRSDRGRLRHFAYVLEAVVLAQWCRAERVDHLHAHFGTNSAAIAMFASTLSGIPYSFTAHGSEEFEKAPLLSLERKLEMQRLLYA